MSSRLFSSFFSSLPMAAGAILLLLSATAGAETPSVETYIYSPTAPASSQPVRPGDLTLSDIIPLKKKAAAPVSEVSVTEKEKPSVAAPSLKTQSQQSTPGVMLMQGLKISLQKSGEDASTVIKAPRLPQPPLIDKSQKAEKAEVTGLAAVSPPAPALAAPDQKPLVETYSYVQGREPKSLSPIVPVAPNKNAAGASEPLPLPSNALVISSTPKTTAASPVVAPSLPLTPIAPLPTSSSRVEGGCGAVNGLATATAPRDDLCMSGMASAVEGIGPWTWSCRGSNGGMTVSCAAPVATAIEAPKASTVSSTAVPASTKQRVEGVCGKAGETPMDRMPETDLCMAGVASAVSGSGPWTWACSGMNGGRAAACQTGIRADGVCGGSHNGNFDEMPMTELCAGGVASAVTGAGPWNWTCSGLNGGMAASCVAHVYMAGVCGEASMLGHKDTPRDSLCSVGSASAVTGSGPWNWSCSGVNGGVSVTCSAQASVSGVCGSSNGGAFDIAPTTNLCASGRSTRVLTTGANGAWSWTCLGTEAGDSTSCTATRAVAAAKVSKTAAVPEKKPAVAQKTAQEENKASQVCGDAVLAVLSQPSTELCRSGVASDVSGEGPWGWTCTSDDGVMTQCSTVSPLAASTQSQADSDAALGQVISSSAKNEETKTAAKSESSNLPVCGGASGVGAISAPEENLCAQGKASAVKGKGPWSWSCALGKSKTTCKAPVVVDAMCGSANGSIQMAAPSAGLCHSGQTTQIQGKGPWMWSCVGSGGGVTVSCSAGAQSQTKVDGLCGAASATPTLSVPAANLCDSGMPSRVFGEGPWTWTCSGLNGGIASTCNAHKIVAAPPAPPAAAVDAVCGSANGRTYAAQPMDDLCVSGTATSVSGDGPWNWNCLGGNGGMTVSCTALLQPPAPITGVCGSASGVPTNKKPRSGLCTAGISSAVSGDGPWTWSCSGTNGGGAVACVAPLSGNSSSSGLPSLVTPSDAPVTPVHRSTLVTPQLPSGPLPPTAPIAFPPSPVDLPAPKFEKGAGVGTADDHLALPPPIRDMAQPTLPKRGAVGSKSIESSIPGNRFVLDDGVSTVTFEAGSGNIPADMVDRLDRLSAILSVNSGVRVMLTAYADSADNTPREARRLSLTRALAVRDYLVTKGVASSRVDVRARGANTSSGEMDRVDITVN